MGPDSVSVHNILTYKLIKSGGMLFRKQKVQQKGETAVLVCITVNTPSTGISGIQFWKKMISKDQNVQMTVLKCDEYVSTLFPFATTFVCDKVRRRVISGFRVLHIVDDVVQMCVKKNVN